MPNYLPKGRERMQELGRKGGRKSGDARRANAEGLRLIRLAHVYVATHGKFTRTEVEEFMKPVNHSGGSHDEDWRCPQCRHFNSTKRLSCAKCRTSCLEGRVTRAELSERSKEHGNDAILRRHGH